MKDSFESQKADGYAAPGSRFAEYGRAARARAEPFKKKPFPEQSGRRLSAREKTFAGSRRMSTHKRASLRPKPQSRLRSRRASKRGLSNSKLSFDSGQRARPAQRSHSTRAQRLESGFAKQHRRAPATQKPPAFQGSSPGAEYLERTGQASALVQSNYWGKRVNKVPLIGHRSKSLNSRDRYQNRLAQAPFSRIVGARDSHGSRGLAKSRRQKEVVGGARALKGPSSESGPGMNSSGSFAEKFSKGSGGSQPFSMGKYQLSGFTSPQSKGGQQGTKAQAFSLGLPGQAQAQADFLKKPLRRGPRHMPRKSELAESAVHVDVEMKFVNKAGLEKGVEKVSQDSVLISKFKISGEVFFVFAILDGHGSHGHHVSQFAKKNIVTVIKFFLRKQAKAGAIRVKPALRETCYYMNSKIKRISEAFCKKWGSELNASLARPEGSFESFDASLSGTTCSLVMLRRNKLYSLSLGDSKALLGSLHAGQGLFRMVPSPISFEHKASSRSEQNRVRAAGGILAPLLDKDGKELGPLRVWNAERKYPGLMVTRSFGDLMGKQCGVSGEPDIIDVNLKRGHRCLIVASDGFWDVNSDSEALASLYSKETGQMLDSEKVLLDMTKRTIERWGRSFKGLHRDDISIILVYFHHL